MSKDQLFPADYYLSFPHLQLMNKRFLIIDNYSLYEVKIKKEQSHVSFIEHISDVLKMDVIMVSSKHGSKLFARFLPREGKKKSYYVGPMKFGYRKEDWQRIIEFFRSTGFSPHKHLNPNWMTKFIPINPDEQVWFSPNDRIFQLYEDPVFFSELKTIKIGFWTVFLTILGISGVIPGIILASSALEDTWIAVIFLFSVCGLFLLYGLPKWIRYVKRKKEFGQKYNIEYYFK